MSIINRIKNVCKSGRSVDRITVEQDERSGAWFYRRRNVGGVNLVSKVNWTSAILAAEAAARVVASEQGKSKLDLQGHLRDDMIAIWTSQGIQAYRNEEPWRCWNSFQHDGYRAAKAESERIAVIGWPLSGSVSDRCRQAQEVAHG